MAMDESREELPPGWEKLVAHAERTGHAEQLDLPQKFLQTTKIYSPHRRSIQ